MPTSPAPFAGSDVRLNLQLDRETFAPAEDPNTGERTFSALVLPWNTVVSDYRRLSFNAGSATFQPNVSQTKLIAVHATYDLAAMLGVATATSSEADGLHAVFRMATTPDADTAWTLMKDGVLDGVSCGVTFGDYSGVIYDEDNDVFVVSGGVTVTEVSLVPIPAFANARIEMSAASDMSFAAIAEPATAGLSFNRGESMPEELSTTPAAAAPVTVQFDSAALTDALTAGNVQLAEAISTGILAGLKTQAEELAAAHEGAAAAPGGVGYTNPRPVYSFGTGDAKGSSWIKDAFAEKMGRADDEQKTRLATFAGMLEDGRTQVFTPDTRATQPAITPTIPRQDLYVPQLAYDTPLYDAVSTASLPTDTPAQPFTLPKWVSSTNLSQDHTEGTNSAAGTISLTTQTITPTTIDGLYQGSRELFESSTPMLDQIVRDAMLNAYWEKIETRIRARLAAVNFANVAVSGSGAVLGDAIGKIYAQQVFQRGGFRIDQTVASYVPFLALDNAKDSAGRPLFPIFGAMNADGTKNGAGSLDVKGRPVTPAYSLVSSGDDATSSTGELFVFASRSVWEWLSPLRSWRFEERNGPSVIELAVFGYEAGAVIRDSDVRELNYTVA